MTEKPALTVVPQPLAKIAEVVASQYGDKGAIVISSGPGGIRIGCCGLTAEELREALCVAIHQTYRQF